MEIKVEVDEARIIRGAMKGLTKKEIEDKIIWEIKEKVIEKVKNDVYHALPINEYEKKATEEFKKEIIERLSRPFLTKKFKKGMLKNCDLQDAIINCVSEDFRECVGEGWFKLDMTLNWPEKIVKKKV